MNEQALLEKAIDDFRTLGWKSRPDETVIDIASAAPSTIPVFAESILQRLPEGATFFDHALSFLPEKQWPSLIEKALEAYNPDGANGAADSVIACASLQSPQSLHPFLDKIFYLRPNSDTYYENWPWRESGTAILDLVEEVDFTTKIFEAAIESRDMEVMEWCIDHSDSFVLDMELSDYLGGVGFAFQKKGMQKLYSDTTYHLVFPESYLPSHTEERFKSKRNHPTWKLTDTASGAVKVGGKTQHACDNCGRQKAHLITLDPIPAGLPITGTPSYELSVCMTCVLGYEAPAIKETTATLCRTPKRWRWQDWGLSNGRENLHRIGGFPTWVQWANYSACGGCQKPMTVVLQIASELPREDGSLLFWGSGGIGYALWCDDCKKSSFTWQST